MSVALHLKTQKIQHITRYLIDKYGADRIVITDLWDGDNMAVGLTDVSAQYTVYISDFNSTSNRYFVALENPPRDASELYSPAGDYNEQTLEEVERLVVQHLLRHN